MRSLVVDDEYVALSKMVLMLEAYGSCDAATNGDQAMSMLRDAIDSGAPYDLIALDINMPGTGGLQLIGTMDSEEQCRQAHRSSKIMVSAASTRANVIRAMERHCDGFLVKPVSREVLAAALLKLGHRPLEECEAAPVEEPAGLETLSPAVEEPTAGRRRAF